MPNLSKYPHLSDSDLISYLETKGEVLHLLHSRGKISDSTLVQMTLELGGDLTSLRSNGMALKTRFERIRDPNAPRV